MGRDADVSTEDFFGGEEGRRGAEGEEAMTGGLWGGDGACR